METVSQLTPLVGIATLCAALGLSRASFYRQRRLAVAPVPVEAAASSEALLGGGVHAAALCRGDGVATAPPMEPDVAPVLGAARRGVTPIVVEEVANASPRTPSPRALSSDERADVIGILHEPRFIDLAPAEIHATLLDEDRYLCSERTMYRILAANHEVQERRNQSRHPRYAAPELLATKPNELWSWDITKLRGPERLVYYCLYVVLDVFSRYVVGWMVAEKESADLATRLFDETIDRQAIQRGQLTAHADRGAAMKSQSLAELFARLDVRKTHSRPSVSNDNPFSESQFKTLKYRPDYPARFGSLEDARAFCRDFFAWYNNEHHHVGLSLLTPHVVHHGLAQEHLARRARTLRAAYLAHPERFVRNIPAPKPLPEKVWINPPKGAPTSETAQA